MWKQRRKARTTADAYQDFNWGASKTERDVTIPPVPKELFAIGVLLNLTYLPYKSSQKPHQPHIHKFGDFGGKTDYNTEHMPVLAGDKQGNLWIVKDASAFYLDRRGIVG